MDTLQVDILNPKAAKLLKSMEELRLISIRGSKGNGFLKVIDRLVGLAPPEEGVT